VASASFRALFQRFTELVMAQSGGIVEATQFARPCEVGRPTIANDLRVLEATFVALVVRPCSTRRPTEIVAAPKVYGFDTGFICYYRGWQNLRNDDLGTPWEHFVLNEIMARSQSREVFYWRDKRGHDVDFVIADPPKETSSHRVQMVRKQFRPIKPCCIPAPTFGRRQRPRSM
jgi:predicted AAA+ superfamily ATPase